MPTASNSTPSSNGNGPPHAEPPERPGAAWDPESVTKDGPFDLDELQRLANEMFAAVPGAWLPGLDPGQVESVAPAPEAESLRPPPDAVPSANGHLPAPNGHLPSPTTGLVRGAPTPVAPVAMGPGPAASRPSAGGGLFSLSGDPLPLGDLGLAGLPRGMVEDPYAGSYSFLEESGPAPAAVAADRGDTDVPPTVSTAGSRHSGCDAAVVRGEFPALSESPVADLAGQRRDDLEALIQVEVGVLVTVEVV